MLLQKCKRKNYDYPTDNRAYTKYHNLLSLQEFQNIFSWSPGRPFTLSFPHREDRSRIACEIHNNTRARKVFYIKEMSKTGRRSSPQTGKWESKEFRASQGRKNHSAVTSRPQKVWKRQIRRNAEAVWQNGRSESCAERRPAQPLKRRYGPAY